ncbi:23S rRNA (adenine1618-N6)-methyltransferase [Pedobacter nutrimenti]|uniref:Ribosomal RNA large subunit methyltransferase F n=2 Tax=Pedobacter nutrimenti TaxID=1241337 RepID=A0A318UMI5_9SPHI|nr:23S rRNA (adenine1618-N6)-methyltransferase [Pedobacter nutrimenti]
MQLNRLICKVKIARHRPESMSKAPKEEKKNLHPRNKHRFGYDFELLVRACPPLRDFVQLNPYGNESIDFGDPYAVKMLNKAILAQDYKIDHWDIPEGYLCPPIPGRADYIHFLADLLAQNNEGKIPRGKGIKVLDIGVGANCIYPIIGHQEYGWAFVGSDMDKGAIRSAENIVAANASLNGAVRIRLQANARQIFKGIIKTGESFSLSLCNPPFHASAEEASAGSRRKQQNLGKTADVLNFGGRSTELWCEGGELDFIRRMIEESTLFARQCVWFSTLVSKSAHLGFIDQALEKVGAAQVRRVEMAQGQKISRFVAWSFQNPLL